MQEKENDQHALRSEEDGYLNDERMQAMITKKELIYLINTAYQATEDSDAGKIVTIENKKPVIHHVGYRTFESVLSSLLPKNYGSTKVEIELNIEREKAKKAKGKTEQKKEMPNPDAGFICRGLEIKESKEHRKGNPHGYF